MNAGEDTQEGQIAYWLNKAVKVQASVKAQKREAKSSVRVCVT